VVLGAPGGTGRELVKQALGRGHDVTVFVRSPALLKDFENRIDIRQGDLLNRASLEQVIQGHDVVLSGFGARVPVCKEDSTLLERFGRALTTAMPHAGVRRVIVESVAFLFKDSIFPPAYLLGRLFFTAHGRRYLGDGADHRQHRSGLDDGAPSGTYGQAVHRQVSGARGTPATVWP
jgi:hypothetical protein